LLGNALHGEVYWLKWEKMGELKNVKTRRDGSGIAIGDRVFFHSWATEITTPVESKEMNRQSPNVAQRPTSSPTRWSL